MFEFEKAIHENHAKNQNTPLIRCHKFENSLIELHEKREIYDGQLTKLDFSEKSILKPDFESVHPVSFSPIKF